MAQLFIDMDGVLADFEAHHESLLGWRPNRGEGRGVRWDDANLPPDFFVNMPAMPDMQQLWDFVLPYRPIVLSGIPAPERVPCGAAQKIAWAQHHLGTTVEVRCCRASEKYRHCSPGDILVDDWEKYRGKWEKAGGIWITHTSAADTITKMRTLYAAALQACR